MKASTRDIALFVVSLMALGGIAVAQAPDASAPTGPHNPNPPQTVPDVQPAPPCGSNTVVVQNTRGAAEPTSAGVNDKAAGQAGQNPKSLADMQCADAGAAASGAAAKPPALPPHP